MNWKTIHQIFNVLFNLFQIPNTIISVCTVVAYNGTAISLSPQEPLLPGQFLYHRFDLIQPEQPCIHSDLLATKSKQHFCH